MSEHRHDHDSPAPTADGESALVFPFAFERAFEVAARPFGITPPRARVTVTDDDLDIIFGPWSLTTPLANVAGAAVTGPYTIPKVIGPPRLSLADRGITFGSNHHHGVCIRFHEPVPALFPVGVLKHPSATVTVQEPARLGELLDVVAERDEAHVTDDLLDEVHLSLTSMTAAELRQRARDLGVPRASRLSKAELVEALETHGADTGGDSP